MERKFKVIKKLEKTICTTYDRGGLHNYWDKKTRDPDCNVEITIRPNFVGVLFKKGAIVNKKNILGTGISSELFLEHFQEISPAEEVLSKLIDNESSQLKGTFDPFKDGNEYLLEVSCYDTRGPEHDYIILTKEQYELLERIKYKNEYKV